MSEYRRKSLRSFYCEEGLWKAYEKLARERDQTIDQLLSDALQRYLDGGTPAASSPAPAPASTIALGAAPAPARPAAPALQSQTGELRSDRATLERMPAVRTAPPPPPARPPRVTPPPAPAIVPGGGMPKLFVHYGGHVYPVNKAEFVIGRGSSGTDLTIRDGNISRKHAVVLFHNGGFFMQDLGSTNGVEFNGQRVETKAIEEGDAFTICDHEITFSYRG